MIIILIDLAGTEDCYLKQTNETHMGDSDMSWR